MQAIESQTPEWLTVPERGLYTGVAIFGAVGSGKTSACMHPFARQLLGWQAKNPERRPAALVLEVKGYFCHDIRLMLVELDRGEDYIELCLDGRLTWNPLSATWLYSYSLAYTVAFEFRPDPADPTRYLARLDTAAITCLKEQKIEHWRERFESTTAREIRLRVEAVNRWYVHDWNTLDHKIRSSIVDGVSVFLSMFDLPSVARVFCPPAPEGAAVQGPAGQQPTDAHETDSTPLAARALSGDLPPLDQLIESGKVLALNMPAGTNPALARAVGVMLKNAWLQSLLLRPAKMKDAPGRYVRPAVFICDEYQAFASVAEDDPSGDEKAFALTRQCRVIPIVATQSISSLRSVLGSGEAWRTLLQTLRTRIFLSLSDEASAEIASKLCGQVAKIKSSYTINESAKSSGINLMSAQAGGGRGSVGASKSFQERREALFQPRDFALLGNCQAICLPYSVQGAVANGSTRSVPPCTRLGLGCRNTVSRFLVASRILV